MFFFRTKQEKEPWQVAAARFCLENSEKGVSESGLIDFLKDAGYEVKNRHASQFFFEEIKHPPGQRFSRDLGEGVEKDENGLAVGYWSVPLSLVAVVNDYDELRQARQSADDAKFWAWVAIMVAIAMPLVVSSLFTQKVEIANSIPLCYSNNQGKL